MPRSPVSTDTCRPVEDANTTMPPFSLALTVLTNTFMSTGGRLALPAAWAGARRARVPVILWTSLWAHPRSPAHALSYLAHGYLGIVSGHNSLLEPVGNAESTAFGPVLSSFHWRISADVSPYGILWTRIEIAVAQLCRDHVVLALLLFKAIALAASLASAALIWRILGRMSPHLQLAGTLAPGLGAVLGELPDGAPTAASADLARAIGVFNRMTSYLDRRGER